VEAVLSGARDFSLVLAEASQVSAARMAAQRMAGALGFDPTRTGRMSIAVTEAATNMVRHAHGGTLAVRAVWRGEVVGIEALAVDGGPGMKSFAASAVDGVSSAGSAGTGLGAIQRMADEFDVYTRPGSGTAMRMVFWQAATPPPFGGYEIGAICVPRAGETESGDAWEVVCDASGLTLVVADGLGHGPDAAHASGAAVETLRRNPAELPIRLLDRIHGRLRATRGAAIGILRHDAGSDEVAFAGVGNIAMCITAGELHRTMVSHNGIVGHNVHRSEEYRYPWPLEALLVAHSDGLETHWDIAAFPGLALEHPSLIAAMLYQKHTRKRDDVVVVVARQKPAGR
jgi:anti-sigma regulatory factor (Ser/Thr protein kinase)